MRYVLCVAVVGLCAVGAVAAAPGSNQPVGQKGASRADIPRGEVHRVACGKDGADTYHCYVPKAYDPARRWPVVYGFSPGEGAGKDAATRWAPVAERHGWVVAWSDQASTGRFDAEAVRARFEALMASVRERVTVHADRSYATGFSAGARWAVAMARMFPDRFAGVIPVGGFFPPTRGDHPKHLYVFAIAGKGDPNLRELRAAGRWLGEQGVPFEIRTFDGDHAIAPARLLDEGVRWLTRQWFVHHDDTSPEGRKERLAAADEMLKDIQDLLDRQERSEAYEAAAAFRDIFGNTTHPPLKRRLDQAAATIAALEKDPSVAGMAAYTAPEAGKVVGAFLKALDANPDIDQAKKAEVRTAVEAARRQPDRMADALVDGLVRLYPGFGKALDALGDEDTASAIAALEGFRESPDPYLAAHSAYFTGRAYVMDERYEEAMPLLAKVAGQWIDRTLFAGDSLFLVGICQGRLLRRKAAVRILQDFLTHYPEAPERMRVGADYVARTIETIQEGSLTDVQERMDDSRRRLPCRNGWTIPAAASTSRSPGSRPRPARTASSRCSTN